MSEEYDWELALVILEHKIVNNAAHKYSDLGFMTVRDIKNGLLSQFSQPEVDTAITFAVRDGFLEVYWEVRCPQSGASSYILEEDPEYFSTRNQIINGDFRCEGCECSNGKRIVEMVYAIPVNKMGNDTEEMSSESPLQRLFRWMFGWLLRK